LLEGITKWGAFRLARALTWPARAVKRAVGRRAIKPASK